MNKSQKLEQKIATLKAELAAARAHEIKAARVNARHEIDRAIKASGLLALVSAGGLSSEALSSEFRLAAERLKAGPGESHGG